MSDSKFPLKISLENRYGKSVARGEISHHEDTCTFRGIPTGIYRAKGIFTDGTQAQSDEVKLHPSVEVTFHLKDFLPSTPPLPINPPKPEKELIKKSDSPPVKAIISSAIGISLLSNFGGSQPLIQEISKRLLNPQAVQPSLQNQPSSLQPRPGNTQGHYQNRFSPTIEARLRTCIQSNFIRLSNIPTLSGLLESVSFEREISSDFERQIILSYTKFQQLQATIEECDPSLAQEILATQEQINISEPLSQKSIVVVGEIVNIRVGPSKNDAILEQVTYGTTLLIDQETSATLTPDQKLAITQGTGWQPILLSNSRRGYIYSLYVRQTPNL